MISDKRENATSSLIALSLLWSILLAAPLAASQAKEKLRPAPPGLTAAMPEPPAGYEGRVMEVLHVDIRAEWLPELPELSVRQSLVLRARDNPDAPLMIELSLGTYDIDLDSVLFSAGIDSLRIVGNGGLRVFGGPSAGTTEPDTLRLVYRSGRGGLTALDSLLYPPGTQYSGLGQWYGFPEYAQGLWTSSLSVVAPEAFTVISAGERTDSIALEGGRTLHCWRIAHPNLAYQLLEIGRHSMTVADSAGFRVSFYHHGRPDSLVRDFTGWALRALAVYSEWFGNPPYDEVRLVETPRIAVSAFSTPALIGFDNRVFDIDYRNDSQCSLLFTEMTVCHEVAHQWWAGLVQSVEHRSMLEALCEYCAVDLASDSLYHRQVVMKSYIQHRIRDALGSSRDKPLLDPSGGLFYTKGPWVMIMLEQQVGREAFHAALADLARYFAYRDASLDDMLSLMEQRSGRDLSWFRREWFERAGYPVLDLESKLEPQGDSWSATVLISQKGEPFLVPLELEACLPGGESVRRSLTLTGSRDTLVFELGQRPDSIVADPDMMNLLDARWQVTADLFRMGDQPAVSDGHDVRFFLDGTLTYSFVRLYHDAREPGTWDSLDLDPDSLESGYVRARIPACSPGRELGFWLRYQDISGIEYTFPADAPEDSVFHFRVNEQPPLLRRGFVVFIDESYVNKDLTREAFTGNYAGIAGFDLQTGSLYGTLYGVGALVPRYDHARGRLAVLNSDPLAVDVIDVENWRLEKRILLPEDFDRSSVHSALNRRDGIYYLQGGQLLAVDLDNGTVSMLEDDLKRGYGVCL